MGGHRYSRGLCVFYLADGSYLLTNHQKYDIMIIEIQKEVMSMNNVWFLFLLLIEVLDYAMKAKALDEMIPDPDFE